jgi:hypothetical protein
MFSPEARKLAGAATMPHPLDRFYGMLKQLVTGFNGNRSFDST